jgi:hypothetical protein
MRACLQQHCDEDEKAQTAAYLHAFSLRVSLQ